MINPYPFQTEALAAVEGALGGVPPMVAVLLHRPDQVATLSPAAARGLLVEVAGVQQRLATVTMMLTVRLRQDGDAAEATLPPSRAQTEQGALTQAAAATAYNMSLRTIRKLTRTGRIPSYVLGRNRMVLPTDFDRYIARCRAQGVKVGTILDV